MEKVSQISDVTHKVEELEEMDISQLLVIMKGMKENYDLCRDHTFFLQSKLKQLEKEET